MAAGTGGSLRHTTVGYTLARSSARSVGANGGLRRPPWGATGRARKASTAVNIPRRTTGRDYCGVGSGVSGSGARVGGAGRGRGSGARVGGAGRGRGSGARAAGAGGSRSGRQVARRRMAAWSSSSRRPIQRTLEARGFPGAVGQLRTVLGDEDRGGLALDAEGVPGGETPLPEHAERHAVAGDEVPGLVEAVLRAEADHVDTFGVGSSELLEARGFPGAVRSMGGPEPVEGRAVGPGSGHADVDVRTAGDIAGDDVGDDASSRRTGPRAS